MYQKKIIFLTSCLILPIQVHAAEFLINNFLNKGEAVFQTGFYGARQGKSQHIDINDVIGDDFSVKNGWDQNALIGFAYFLPINEYNHFSLAYGINAFYFFKTRVSGDVTQENLFTNLSYSYDITNLPIYAVAKALIQNTSNRYNITLDAGVGSNIIRTSHFQETSLDGGVTVPEHAFTGTTNTVFSAMAGIGIRVNHLLGKMAVECGYRFFYLGQDELDSANSQIIDKLKTGNSYAQAVVCGLIV